MSAINSVLAATTNLDSILTSNISVDELDMATANTTYSYALPIGTKGFSIHARTDGLIKFSNDNTMAKYFTIFPGQPVWRDNVSNTATPTFYFQSPKANQKIEILRFV